MLEEGKFDPLAHYLHQDNLVWQAFTWTITVEAAVIAAGFSEPGLTGACAVVLGTAIILAFAAYAWKATKDRDVNLPVLDAAAPKGFRLAAAPDRKSRTRHLTGRNVLIFGFGCVLVANAMR